MPINVDAIPDDYDVTIARATVEQVAPMDPLAKLDAERRGELESFLRTWLPELRRERDDALMDLAKWKSTLMGKRKTAPIKQGMSNLSVPLTMWASSATRARLDQGIIGSKPMLVAQPIGKPRGEDGTDYNQIAADLARWLEAEIRSPRALNGEEMIRKGDAEDTNWGAAAGKVCVEGDEVRLTAPREKGGKPVETIERGRIRWEHISLQDLIYVNGYGTDTQAMPVVGHRFVRNWAWIKQQATLHRYDAAAVEEVERFYTEREADTPAPLRRHSIEELYLDFPVDSTGLMAALIVDWHVDAERALWVRWNRHPRGLRPIYMSLFDFSPDVNDALGQGVAAKCAGAQDETDVIHNLTIEAVKRAIAHIIVLKGGTGAEEELGGGDPILPGSTCSTENPAEDIVAVPLGDPKGIEAGLAIEMNSLRYVFRILGFDESSLGQVEAGKRVPASLGLTSIREGRIVISNALASRARMLENMAYYTIEMYKYAMPVDTLYSVLSQEAADAVKNIVFGADDIAFRSQFAITFNAQDAATMQESRKQELIVLNQMLMAFYDKIIQYAVMAVQAPEPIRNALVQIMTKVEHGVRAMLTTMDSIPNPDEVLIRVSEFTAQLEQVAAGMGGGALATAAAPTAPAGPPRVAAAGGGM